MSVERMFLVIRADRTARVVRRTPALRDDEVAMRLNVHFPDSWGRVMSPVLDVHLPEPPVAEMNSEVGFITAQSLADAASAMLARRNEDDPWHD